MDEKVNDALKIICQALKARDADGVDGYVIDVKARQAYKISIKKVDSITELHEDKGVLTVDHSQATDTEKEKLIKSILKDFPEESK